MRAQGSITISCLTIYITGLSIISMFLKSTRYSINPSYISVGWYCFCLLSFLISLLFIKTTGGTIIFTIGSFLRKTRRTTLTTKFFWHNMLNFTVHLHPLLFHSQLFLIQPFHFLVFLVQCFVHLRCLRFLSLFHSRSLYFLALGFVHFHWSLFWRVFFRLNVFFFLTSTNFFKDFVHVFLFDAF